MNEVKALEDRSYKTYKSRLHAYERLQHRATAWNFTLVMCNTILLLLTIYISFLSKNHIVVENYCLICASTLTLVVSMIVAGVGYERRAHEMYRNYRALQRYSSNLEAKIASSSMIDVVKENTRYQDLLDFTENHSENDFLPFKNGNYETLSTIEKIEMMLKHPKTIVLNWCAPGVVWLMLILLIVLAVILS